MIPKVNVNNVEFKLYNEWVHFFLSDQYIGMVFFKKGEVSDHRGIIRQNRIKINNNPYRELRTALFAMLNHTLAERFFLEGDELQKIKESIVKVSDKNIKDISKIIEERLND